MSTAAPPRREASIWHVVECGAYAADLSVWADLAGESGGAVLELGCGTGRVALALARAGHSVVAVDRDPELLEVLAERAAAEGVSLAAERADALELDLGRTFDLVLAPMQLLQVLGGPRGRRRVLEAMRRHLAPSGIAAAAIVDGDDAPAPGAAEAEAALPDVRDVDGWVYSSLPVRIHADGVAIEATRLRQRVSPSGELEESTHVDRLERLDAGLLEVEADAAGLRSAGRRQVVTDEAYVGATILLWSLA
jgi:SAM-dependent methyltransferase